MNELQRLGKIKLRSSEDASAKKRRERERRRIAASVRRGSYGELLQQAGFQFSSQIWVMLVALTCVVGTIALVQIVGALVGLVTGPILCYYFLFPYLVARAEKRRQQVVPHLPAFIDTLEASLATGFNMEVAFEHAVTALPEGILQEEGRRVLQLLEGGVTLDEGLGALLRRISGQEIIALVTTIRLFSGVGGRVLEPLQRLSKKVREQQGVLERAARDLVGTKNAFYVILALSIMVPIFSLTRDPEYLKAAFEHPVLRYVMQVCLVIEVICIMMFKRLTSLKI